MNYLSEFIIREAFYQNFPLKLDRFIDYCENRDLFVNEKKLEKLDEIGIFKPIMRIHGNYVSNTTDLKEMYQNGCVDDPHLADFIPWENFYEKKDGLKQEIIHSYYHPYQIYFLKEILTIQMKISPFSFPQEDEDLLKNVRKFEKFLTKRLENLGQDTTHDEFVELLIFIQNKYLPLVKQPCQIIVTGDINDSIEKWNELQEKIIPEEIIRTLDLDAEKIKEYRKSIGHRGLSIDPMERWYDLIKYIVYDKRQKLKGKALLAQDFYLMSDMLRLFLEDLTGNKQLETGIIFDSEKGQGNIRNYGKELNYIDRDVLIKILREFGINPKPRLILIVEGHTEETAIPIIANSMGIPLDRFAIEIINIRGIDKSQMEYLIHISTPDIYQIDKKSYIHPERTKIYIVLDNEMSNKHWFRNPAEFIKTVENVVLDIIQNNLDKEVTVKVKDILHKNTVEYKIFDKCFEYDNFSNEELSRELNSYGEKYGYQFNVTPDEIEECRKINRNLRKFIEEKTGTNLSKKEFGFQLANMVADEIQNRKDKFDNQRSIEKILENIVTFTTNP